MTEEELLKKRFLELAKKSESCGYFLFTDFLGLMEQSTLSEVKSAFPKNSFATFGGVAGAERIMVRFGNCEELGYAQPFPISILKIEPRAPKFADKLSHRDFLGSLLSLGIERRALGDIAIVGNVGYLFCKEDIAEFIKGELVRIKHTDVDVEIIGTLPDECELYKTRRVRIQASGERLDAVVAKVFSLSRESAQSLFKKRLVFVGGRLCESVSYTPRENDVVSVRGYGRFIYRGYESLSKKGKLNIEVDIYV